MFSFGSGKKGFDRTTGWSINNPATEKQDHDVTRPHVQDAPATNMFVSSSGKDGYEKSTPVPCPRARMMTGGSGKTGYEYSRPVTRLRKYKMMTGGSGKEGYNKQRPPCEVAQQPSGPAGHGSVL